MTSLIHLSASSSLDCEKEDEIAFRSVDTKLYRKGVAVIITNGYQLLILQRKGTPIWQLVQGGIEDSDNSLETLHKEMQEEVGLYPDQYKILAKMDTAISYNIPPGTQNPRYKDTGIIGQAHIYYLVIWRGDISELDFSDANEFDKAKWVDWKCDSLNYFSHIKVDAYNRALVCMKGFLHGL